MQERKREHILIVDDERIMNPVGETMAEEKGWTVSYLDPTMNARDISQQAVNIPHTMLCVEPFFFVIDYPEMRFRSVFESLTTEARARRAPILAFTTQDEETLSERYNIRKGKDYDAYLCKPVTYEAVIKNITRLLVSNASR
jgi:CheY-like chemotaxis protein